MTQGILPYKYEEKKRYRYDSAGRIACFTLIYPKVIGLSKSIQKHLKIRTNKQGWTDQQMVLLNLAGGNCVEDLKYLL